MSKYAATTTVSSELSRNDIVVKAKLEAVESGIAMFEEEFLAYIVLPNGMTVKDVVVPEIKKAYEIKDYTPNFLLLEG